jgi:hypothetical protein
MVFAGEPDQVAERILHLHELLGHSRQILQMDVGGRPHATFLKSIELLGTKVLPGSARSSTSGEASAEPEHIAPRSWKLYAQRGQVEHIVAAA